MRKSKDRSTREVYKDSTATSAKGQTLYGHRSYRLGCEKITLSTKENLRAVIHKKTNEAGPRCRVLLRLVSSFSLSVYCCRYLAYQIREIRGKQLDGDCKQDYSEELACEVYTALTKQPYKERCSTEHCKHDNGVQHKSH